MTFIMSYHIIPKSNMGLIIIFSFLLYISNDCFFSALIKANSLNRLLMSHILKRVKH